MPIIRERLNPIKRERLCDVEPIKRERLHDDNEPIKLEKRSDFAPPRRKRKSSPKLRGPNKPQLITDGRQVLNRRELASICGVSVDTVKKWESKRPGESGLERKHFGPKGRLVLYSIDQAEGYLKIALRPRPAMKPSTDAPDETPPPSEQPPKKSS
jgi:hypothetical protein